MAEVYTLTTEPISIDQIGKIVKADNQIELSTEASELIQKCRDYLDKRIENTTNPIYGINTGFGSLYDKNIDQDKLGMLQENLVKSHACGAGAVIPDEIVKLMLLLKIRALSYGHSGVQLETVRRLIYFYNNNIIPTVFEFGSLGASGDLAPLAHMCLPLIGDGEAKMNGKKILGKDLNDSLGWDAIELKAKEGLALLNGTQFMSAYGICGIVNAKHLLDAANLIGALSLDAFDGRQEPFAPEVHRIRPQEGQGIVASTIREILQGSELIGREKAHVQDPYSFRCIPQVHGASRDAIEYVEKIFTNEVNGVSDNPNIFPDEDLIISAGNFHGQPLALSLDFLCLALAELGNISERRTYQLISGSRNLPNYLVANPGINSGLMIPQYTAASLVSKNKELCVPSSSDSIVSSNGQEDHVSMGANAALKVYKLVSNLYSILAIELITAAQALEFRRPSKSSPRLEALVSEFRKKVEFLEQDRVIHDDMVAAEEFIKSLKFE